MRFFKSFTLLHRKSKSDGNVTAKAMPRGHAQTRSLSFVSAQQFDEQVPVTDNAIFNAVVPASNIEPIPVTIHAPAPSQVSNPAHAQSTTSPLSPDIAQRILALEAENAMLKSAERVHSSATENALNHRIRLLEAEAAQRNLKIEILSGSSVELEATIEELRATIKDLQDIIEELLEERRCAQDQLFDTLQRDRYLTRQAKADDEEIERLEERIRQSNKFLALLVDIGLHEPVLERVQVSLRVGYDADEAMIDSIKEAAEKPGSPWASIIPAITGPRTSDHYLSAIDATLKVRKELKECKKVAKFWKQAAKEDHNHAETITPSTSNLSDIIEELSEERQFAVDELLAKLRNGGRPVGARPTFAARAESPTVDDEYHALFPDSPLVSPTTSLSAFPVRDCASPAPEHNYTSSRDSTVEHPTVVDDAFSAPIYPDSPVSPTTALSAFDANPADDCTYPAPEHNYTSSRATAKPLTVVDDAFSTPIYPDSPLGSPTTSLSAFDANPAYDCTYTTPEHNDTSSRATAKPLTVVDDAFITPIYPDSLSPTTSLSAFDTNPAYDCTYTTPEHNDTSSRDSNTTIRRYVPKLAPLASESFKEELVASESFKHLSKRTPAPNAKVQTRVVLGEVDLNRDYNTGSNMRPSDSTTTQGSKRSAKALGKRRAVIVTESIDSLQAVYGNSSAQSLASSTPNHIAQGALSFSPFLCAKERGLRDDIINQKLMAMEALYDIALAPPAGESIDSILAVYGSNSGESLASSAPHHTAEGAVSIPPFPCTKERGQTDDTTHQKSMNIAASHKPAFNNPTEPPICSAPFNYTYNSAARTLTNIIEDSESGNTSASTSASTSIGKLSTRNECDTTTTTCVNDISGALIPDDFSYVAESIISTPPTSPTKNAVTPGRPSPAKSTSPVSLSRLPVLKQLRRLSVSVGLSKAPPAANLKPTTPLVIAKKNPSVRSPLAKTIPQIQSISSPITPSRLSTPTKKTGSGSRIVNSGRRAARTLSRIVS